MEKKIAKLEELVYVDEQVISQMQELIKMQNDLLDMDESIIEDLIACLHEIKNNIDGRDARFMEILNKPSPRIEKAKKKTYLIFDKSSGLHKIGRSIDPSIRFIHIRTINPTIEMVCMCDVDIENNLHKRFSIKRNIGEWFDLNEKDVKYIKEEFDRLNKRIG